MGNLNRWQLLPVLFFLYVSTSLAQLLPDELNTISVFKKMAPYVVNVHKLQSVVNPFLDVKQIRRGVGSGFIWNNQGYIVTNYHVIRGANKIAVKFGKNQTVLARVVGVAPRKDIAVLKIDSGKILRKINPLQPIALANSNNLLVGQKVIAIGNPFGLEQTLTTGIISAVEREIPVSSGMQIHGMIQTDAAINPGNSGGPLLNSSGKLIGMNTVIFSTSGNSAGIGFAVPANAIKKAVEQIIRYGHTIQPGIGITVLSKAIAKRLGIRGVIVSNVERDSPAAAAGFKGSWRDQSGRIHIGDVIIAVNGHRVYDYDDLYSQFDKLDLGDIVRIDFVRNGVRKTAIVKLVEVKNTL